MAKAVNARLCAVSVLVVGAVYLHGRGWSAEESEPAGKEKVGKTATRLTYGDGTIKYDTEGRGSANPVRFIASAEPENPEPVPTGEDAARGYLVFVPSDRKGVLGEYRPSPEELGNAVTIFASPGEFEPATFCVRPLLDLGMVKLAAGAFTDARGNKAAGIAADLYVVEPTVEQIKLTDDRCRWVPKWLRPTDERAGRAGENIQVYLDPYIGSDTPPGIYKAQIAITPEKGRASTVTIALEVLALELAPPMPWGFFRYFWHEPDKNAEWILWQLREMRRAGMSQCVISPIHYQNRPGIDKDGSVDFSIYDKCIALYQEAGFEHPPVLGMEGTMFGLAEAMGKAEELKFKDRQPGVKAEEVPEDVRAFAAQVVRRVYDHALEAKWPGFYVHFADEPSTGSAKMEKAKFMYGLAREVAPEMRTADGVYTFGWWEPLKGLLDLNIAHYVHPCHNAEANQRWRDLARSQNCTLYGIDFIGPLDTFWEGRQITLTAEKGSLAGMLCWTQWVAFELDESAFDAYYFLANTWKGGPWVMRTEDGRVWRSLPWLGVREGIDDSRYLRTARAWIEKARQSFDPEQRLVADAAERRVQAIMDRVPWVPGVRMKDSPWTNARAQEARRGLAQVAIDLRRELDKN